MLERCPITSQVLPKLDYNQQMERLIYMPGIARSVPPTPRRFEPVDEIPCPVGYMGTSRTREHGKKKVSAPPFAKHCPRQQYLRTGVSEVVITYRPHTAGEKFTVSDSAKTFQPLQTLQTHRPGASPEESTWSCARFGRRPYVSPRVTRRV